MLELLLAREEELTQREEALTTREEKAGILEKALAKVSADLAAERAKAEATRKEYLEKMAAHTARAKHSLGLDKMLGEKKVELNGKERDLVLREAVLAEAQTRGLNPQDNLDDLMESIELWRLLQDAEADRVIDVGRPW
jgi:oligoendopeptidase F